MTEAEMMALAQDQGFEKVAILNTSQLKIVQEYRKYCEQNLCGNYDANYGCPPDCGSPEFMEERVRSYNKVLILQTRVEMDAMGEPEKVLAVKKDHVRMARKTLKELEKAGMAIENRAMLPGPCTFCAACQKKKGNPCPFPQYRTSCISAYGIDVTAMCQACDMRLDWDGSSVSYFSLYLFDPREEEIVIDNAYIEKSIRKKFHKQLFSRFAKGINEYQMIQEGDKIAVCISGGKDSMLMAKLFQELKRHNKFPFELVFLCMDPGYSEINRKVIEMNAAKMEIPLTIFESDIFESVFDIEKSPCYLCARMRRGHLYSKARELGCNKIALGHHYDDVIETILMGMLYGGQVQTMMPKLHSTNFEGMELIRPMYLIREDDIKHWRDYNKLYFLQCACKFTESLSQENKDHESASKRKEVKNLIREMKKVNPFVESNIFRSVENVNLSTVIAYKKDGVVHRFTDDYDACLGGGEAE